MEDFDKYKVLDMVEQLKNVAVDLKDKKADYLRSVYSTLQERVSKPKEQFRNYILTLIGDKDYEKMIESVNKIDKSFNEKQAPKYAAPSPLPVPSYVFPPSPSRLWFAGFSHPGVQTSQAPPPPPPLFPNHPRRFSPYHNLRGARHLTCFSVDKGATSAITATTREQWNNSESDSDLNGIKQLCNIQIVVRVVLIILKLYSVIC